MGTHNVELDLEINGSIFQGLFQLTVANSSKPVIFQGPLFDMKGDVIVGDHQVTMNVSVPGNHAITSDGFSTVLLNLKSTRQITRKQTFLTHDNPQQKNKRLAIRIEQKDDTRRIILSGGISHRLGRNGKSVDIQLVCPMKDDPDERKSEQISRNHALIEFGGKAVRWSDSSSYGTDCGGPRADLQNSSEAQS